MSAAIPANLVGRQWGRYRLERLLGVGGMGIVYRAVHVDLNKPVAIKILKPDLAYDPALLERFKAEARAAAALTHPNLATVHDVGEAEGYHYFVMDLVEGEDLAAIIDRQDGSLPIGQALEMAEQIARALDHAHSRGVIHRDVKPQNVLLGNDGQVKVTDFGIARALERARMTTTGMLVGTPEYMSPEQASGDKIDHRSDVYSLGIVLFEMLTGRVPFHGETPVAVALQQINAQPPSPRALNGGIPPSLEQIVLKALAKRPEERFPSARAMADTLLRARHEFEMRSLTVELPKGVGGRVLAAAERAAPRRSLPIAYVAALVVLVGGVATVAWSVVGGRQEESTPAGRLTPSATEPAGSPSSTALVYIDSVPSGAVVILNGTHRGKTPWKGELAQRTYRVEVVKPGYERWNREVAIAAGGWRTVVHLNPLTPATPTHTPPPARTPRTTPTKPVRTTPIFPATPRPIVTPAPATPAPSTPRPTRAPTPTPRPTPAPTPTPEPTVSIIAPPG